MTRHWQYEHTGDAVAAVCGHMRAQCGRYVADLLRARVAMPHAQQTSYHPTIGWGGVQTYV